VDPKDGKKPNRPALVLTFRAKVNAENEEALTEALIVRLQERSRSRSGSVPDPLGSWLTDMVAAEQEQIRRVAAAWTREDVRLVVRWLLGVSDDADE
jgi:hypothetical protein